MVLTAIHHAVIDYTSFLSQRKATNFYSNANVKNKNRQKSALMKALQKGKGDGRKKRG